MNDDEMIPKIQVDDSVLIAAGYYHGERATVSEILPEDHRFDLKVIFDGDVDDPIMYRFDEVYKGPHP